MLVVAGVVVGVVVEDGDVDIGVVMLLLWVLLCLLWLALLLLVS